MDHYWSRIPESSLQLAGIEFWPGMRSAPTVLKARYQRKILLAALIFVPGDTAGLVIVAGDCDQPADVNGPETGNRSYSQVQGCRWNRPRPPSLILPHLMTFTIKLRAATFFYYWRRWRPIATLEPDDCTLDRRLASQVFADVVSRWMLVSPFRSLAGLIRTV